MRILNESEISKLEKIYNILKDASNYDGKISDVRLSPDNNKIILDMKFNKALEVFIRDNDVIIKGDNNYGTYVQKILQGELPMS